MVLSGEALAMHCYQLSLPEFRTLVTDVLLQASRIYASAQNFRKAKQCLDEAWQLLYTPKRPEAETTASLSAEGVTEYERIELFRTVPTLLGWRLPDAAGWGLKHLFDREADVLAEAAALLQLEEGGKRTHVSHTN